MAGSLSKRFGKRLRDLRKEARLTQQELADESGLHITFIARLETGNRNPTLKSCAALARALGVSLSELMERIDA